MTTGQPLLDRGAETQALERLVADAESGAGGIVVIAGPAGIGKTALIRRAVELAADGGHEILRATGSELETGFPFGVARQLLEGVIARQSEDERSGSLTGAARVAEQVLGAEPRDADEPAELHAAIHGLSALAMNLARTRTLLVAVDDAHWADLTSLHFLHYLARRLGDSPVALLVATRANAFTGGPSPLRGLLTVDGAVVLRPKPLSSQAVAELTRRELGAEPAPEFVDACAQATGGNAFFVTELLRALASKRTSASIVTASEIEGMAPGTVGDRITGWFAALSPSEITVVHSLSILGDADLPLLAAHAGVDVDFAREVCSRLEHASLLSDSEAVGFAHPLVASAVTATMAAGERSDGHLRAAALLRARGASLDACAVHLLAARPAADDTVASILADAAGAAVARGAPAEAIGYLERALAEPPSAARRPVLMLELGRAQLRLHRTADARATLRELRRERPAADIRRAGAMLLSQACYLEGDVDAALDALEDERAEEHDQQRLRVLDSNAISLGLLDPVRCELMRGRLHGYRQAAEAGELHEPTLLALAGAELVLAGGAGDIGSDLIRRGFAGGLTAFGEDAFPFGWAVCALDAHDLTKEAIAHIDHALTQARSRSDGPTVAYLLGYRVHCAMRLGRLAEAEADGRGACELLARVDGDATFPVALIEVLIERDQADEAWELYHRQQPTGSQQRSAMLVLVGARVAIAQGRSSEALAQLLDAGEQLDAMAFLHPLFAPWRVLAAPLADELGDRQLALTLSARLTELATGAGTPSAIAVAMRVAGCLRGDLAMLARSAALAGQTGDLLEYARSLVELGSAQTQQELREDARETLRIALATAHEAGALTLARRARAELIAAGGRPRRAALRGVEALTPSELQVARLAADGLSNRDIADALFVALKTVEQHLARTYSKLEIAGRRELAAALSSPTPPPALPEIARA